MPRTAKVTPIPMTKYGMNLPICMRARDKRNPTVVRTMRNPRLVMRPIFMPSTIRGRVLSRFFPLLRKYDI